MKRRRMLTQIRLLIIEDGEKTHKLGGALAYRENGAQPRLHPFSLSMLDSPPRFLAPNAKYLVGGIHEI